MEQIFPGVYKVNGKIATKNLVKGKDVYGEKLIEKNNTEYRLWDPYRSKLSAAIKKELKNFPFKKNSNVLYLGASYGTTVSHLSDIITNGNIFAVEISAECIQKLLELYEDRENIIPIHADARHPSNYEDVEEVDIVYQDLAQSDQDEILIKNVNQFLSDKGTAFLCLKSASMDSTRDPENIFDDSLSLLESKGFNILQTINLSPFDKQHLFVSLEFE